MCMCVCVCPLVAHVMHGAYAILAFSHYKCTETRAIKKEFLQICAWYQISTATIITVIGMKQLENYETKVQVCATIFIGRRVHNSRKSQLYTYLHSEGHLVLLSSVTEFIEVCTQFQEKPAIHFRVYDSPPLCFQNKQTYTYLAYKNRPLHFQVLSAHNSRKTSYTLPSLREQAFVFHVKIVNLAIEKSCDPGPIC